MDCRVFYRLDGTVEVVHIAPHVVDKNKERVFTKCAEASGLDGLPYDTMDTADLPDKVDREKWRGAKGAGVAVDPSVVTLTERRQAVKDSLAAELDKAQANPVAAIRLMLQLEEKDY